VSSGDIAERNHVHAVQGLACGEGLEGDHNVVRASEFEGMEAQTVLSTPLLRCADWIGAQLVVRPHCTPT
jgi:hypothetical protein